MEDSGAGGDNHSDGDSDKFGNGELYAMIFKAWSRGVILVTTLRLEIVKNI